MLSSLGGFLHRFRWTALVVALVLVVGAGLYGKGAFSLLSNDASAVAGSDSQHANDIIKHQLNASRVDILILFQSDTLTADQDVYAKTVSSALAPVSTLPDVASVTTYYTTGSAAFLSRDGHETFATIRLNDASDPHNAYAQIRAAVQAAPLRVSYGGAIPSSAQLDDQISADLGKMEAISFPLIAIALIVVFGGLVAAILPLTIGAVAILGALAILRVLASFFDISVYSVNIVSVLGLGLAIDYALFIVTRFREELLPNDRDVRGALQRTLATAGRTVLFSGLTVSTCLISLTLFPLVTLRSLGIGSIAAVLVAMFAALTILPAILAALGRNVNALSIQSLIARRSGRANVASPASDTSGAWYRLSQFVMRYPVPVMLVSIAFLVTLGIPFLHPIFAAPDIHALPPDKSARYVYDRLVADFPQGSGSQQVVAVSTSGNALSASNLAALDGYVRVAQQIPHVTGVTSLVSIDPRLTLAEYQAIYANPAANPQLAAEAQLLANGNATQVTVNVDGADNSDAAQSVVRALRQIAPPAGITAAVSGTTAQQLDLFDGLLSHLPRALLVIIVSTLTLLFLMTGSLVVPLKAIVLNFLSLSATFGAVIFVFQEGHFHELLGFTSLGAVDPAQLMILFAIAFGLSMDYEVFLLSRIKEEYDKTGDNRLAVATGLQHTGWLITSAAALLAIVLFATITSQVIFIKQIGLGLGIAVIMDATVVRALLVPATMRILGRWNWWPNLQLIRENSGQQVAHHPVVEVENE